MARIPNHSTQETKEHIKNTFISLYREKEINEITVTELCQKAEINRRTFYNHYEDIYILRKEIEEDVITAFKKFYPTILNSVVKRSFTSETNETVSKFIKEYKDILLLFLTTRTSKDFLETIRKYSSKCIQEILQLKADLSLPENKGIVEYISCGQMGIIIWWITDGQEIEIKDLSEMINQIQCTGALNSFRDNR